MGTRRRSETNLADFEGVTDGSFFKKLAISKSKERDGDRPRQKSLFDQGLDRMANIVRKKSDSKLKRPRSTQNGPDEAENARALDIAVKAPSRYLVEGALGKPKRRASILHW